MVAFDLVWKNLYPFLWASLISIQYTASWCALNFLRVSSKSGPCRIDPGWRFYSPLPILIRYRVHNEVTSNMINVLIEVVADQHIVLERRIHRIFHWMTLDSSDTKNVLFSRICTVLTSFLLSSPPHRWSTHVRTDHKYRIGESWHELL